MGWRDSIVMADGSWNGKWQGSVADRESKGGCVAGKLGSWDTKKLKTEHETGRNCKTTDRKWVDPESSPYWEWTGVEVMQIDELIGSRWANCDWWRCACKQVCRGAEPGHTQNIYFWPTPHFGPCWWMFEQTFATSPLASIAVPPFLAWFHPYYKYTSVF